MAFGPSQGEGGPCNGVDGVVNTEHRSPHCSGQQGKKGRETRAGAAGWPCCRYCIMDQRMQHKPEVKEWMAWDRRVASSSAPSSTAPSSSAAQEQLQGLQEQQAAVEEQVSLLSKRVGTVKSQVQVLLSAVGASIGAIAPPCPPPSQGGTAHRGDPNSGGGRPKAAIQSAPRKRPPAPRGPRKSYN